MHGKRWHANVDGLYAQLTGGNRTYGRAATEIAAGDKTLHRNLGLLAQQLKETGRSLLRVALVRIRP